MLISEGTEQLPVLYIIGKYFIVKVMLRSFPVSSLTVGKSCLAYSASISAASNIIKEGLLCSFQGPKTETVHFSLVAVLLQLVSPIPLCIHDQRVASAPH